jgi:hypothetical protein
MMCNKRSCLTKSLFLRHKQAYRDISAAERVGSIAADVLSHLADPLSHPIGTFSQVESRRKSKDKFKK